MPALERDEVSPDIGASNASRLESLERLTRLRQSGALSDEVSKLYVARYFPPATKAAADELVRNVLAAMGERVAHLVTGRMMDYIKFEDDFAMVKTVAPPEIVGRPLGQTRIRSRHGVTVVGVKKPGEPFTYATQDTVVRADDLVIVSGRIDAVEAFANRR